MSDERVRRRLAAIVTIDMVAYSRRMSEDETGTYELLKSQRRELINPKIGAYSGRIVKLIGDGALVEFGSVVDAVVCANDIQTELRSQNEHLPESEQIEFKIAVNLGDVIADGDDIYGDGVNVAARLEELALPGEVWLSGTVYDQIKSKVDFEIEALGERQLKNIPEPVRVFRIAHGAVGVRLPELKSVGDDLAVPDKPSIAILPFKNLSNEPEQDHLADGFRLDIQAALIKVPALFLIATGTSNGYRDQDVDASLAGHELGVRYILQGDIRKSGNRIRLNVELTDSATQRIVWGNKYDRLLGDTLAMSEEIAAEVLDEIGVELIIGEESRIFQSTLKSFEAKEMFYRGLNSARTLTKDGNAEARSLFERVSDVQPDSPVGPTYVSFSHFMDIATGWSHDKAHSLATAMKWAEKALRFEGTNGLAHVVVAFNQLLNKQHAEALATSYKSVELRPNCPAANLNLASVLLYDGNAEKSLEVMKKAFRLSPHYPVGWVNVLAAAYRDSDDPERSIAAAKRAIELNPANIEARMVLCTDYVRAGHLERAKEIARDIVAIDPDMTIAKYVGNLPYKRQEIVDQMTADLQVAGLPG